jgi:hypothetical protein
MHLHYVINFEIDDARSQLRIPTGLSNSRSYTNRARRSQKNCESHMALEYFLTFCVLVEALLRFRPSVTDSWLEYRTKNFMTEHDKQRLIPFVGLHLSVVSTMSVKQLNLVCCWAYNLRMKSTKSLHTVSERIHN